MSTHTRMGQVFWSGFWKGMAAPAYALDTHVLPPVTRREVTPHTSGSDAERIRAAWALVGVELSKAYATHEQKTKQ